MLRGYAEINQYVDCVYVLLELGGGRARANGAVNNNNFYTCMYSYDYTTDMNMNDTKEIDENNTDMSTKENTTNTNVTDIFNTTTITWNCARARNATLACAARYGVTTGVFDFVPVCGDARLVAVGQQEGELHGQRRAPKKKFWSRAYWTSTSTWLHVWHLWWWLCVAGFTLDYLA